MNDEVRTDRFYFIVHRSDFIVYFGGCAVLKRTVMPVSEVT
jgi:hypothetical protein